MQEPGWKIRLEKLRRDAVSFRPRIMTLKLHGWEFHLSYDPSRLDEGGFDAGWALAAHPASLSPDFAWLREAALFLGVPKDELPDKSAGLSIVTWTWEATSCPACGKKECGKHL